MGFGGGGKGRYDVRDDEPCRGCGQYQDTLLNYCCICWHIYVDTQKQNHGGNAQHLFFPPELDDMMMQARRDTYTRAVGHNTEGHRLAIARQQERQEQWERQEREERERRDRARLDIQLAPETDEDTFVLSNGIANK